MSSVWNNKISISIFGESHGKSIGVVIDKLPSGEKIDIDKVKAFMARRAPRQDVTSTLRKETDEFEILSGFHNGYTTGTPLAIEIKNKDQHSNDYTNMTYLARPGHADFTGNLRYNGYNDIRGGGHFSGRLTAPLVFAGAVCNQILERKGVYTCAHILSIHGIRDKGFDSAKISKGELLRIRGKDIPVIDEENGRRMLDEVIKAKDMLDSVGGVIECCTIGFPAGVGSPMFDGLENNISSMMFGIPAVKGIEFGNGFDATKIYGSENNDEFYVENDIIKTKTNNHGGILGGISSGMPICLKVAFKPTPSIAKEQKTIDYKEKNDAIINIKGRHDPCVVFRAVPCVESVVNIALLSALL